MAHKIESNESSKIIRDFFMNDKEFSELEERIRDVSTTFYQLMSIFFFFFFFFCL